MKKKEKKKIKKKRTKKETEKCDRGGGGTGSGVKKWTENEVFSN